ncbi:TetR/AcrR family transcriptional regulator [Glaciihabitans sp. dw_435]|uniref:TetR/AcrR family transcriptional regulator n=1 Tax=Glaciihabitans sp. dw_435 TaxID=2720081 RepID=UPI001C4A34D8|nr:TetR/AcrR family transcriptional regulator [Glaciihabitans sp. dw_435]
MNDQPEIPSVSNLVRTEPVQQRSAQRISLLLDAAAELIDADGIDSLTTSDVATRSGSSVGVVYRYFPNIQSLLRALAARNMERFNDMVYASLDGEASEWRTALDPVLDAYVALNRSEPGFRSLRFGDIIADRFLDPSMSNNGVLARAFAGILGEKYNFAPDGQLIFDLEVLIEIEDALLKRAFLLDRHGDERFIRKAHELARDYLNTISAFPGAL